MSKGTSAKTTMLEHSQAKVELYGRYLSVYLNILSRVPSTNKIYVFDLLCGEGIYENDVEGSPLIALKSIKNHYFSHNQTCPNITVWFNDNGLSEIEKGVYKTERVKALCSQKFIPDNVTIEFYQEDFEKIYLRALQNVRLSPRSKGLFFIDPYGYKAVKPQHIRNILDSGNTEVILFLPASHMYRFAKKSMETSFPGSEPLREFLIELFQPNDFNFISVYDFIDQVKERFRNYLSQKDIFVDTFTLERDKQNVYCLFFFTSHIRGFEKMLETKWKLDGAQGRGFTLEQSLPLFRGVEGTDYPNKLFEFIRKNKHRTNAELYRFSLSNGFLPKHTNEILKNWKEKNSLEVFPLDSHDKPIRGFYISYKPARLVGFRVIT